MKVATFNKLVKAFDINTGRVDAATKKKTISKHFLSAKLVLTKGKPKAEAAREIGVDRNTSGFGVKRVCEQAKLEELLTYIPAGKKRKVEQFVDELLLQHIIESKK